ncbi:unnamed protein product [Schistosoma margrebowiei]|uniref:Uncharacterized protein n=1 Tax=Schistosoma margrebowiei TaxID=48269 RepID=A0A183LCY2_9TREM|nr:unnamed protein product [Schistosoma margrebowiei]
MLPKPTSTPSEYHLQISYLPKTPYNRKRMDRLVWVQVSLPNGRRIINSHLLQIECLEKVKLTEQSTNNMVLIIM